MVASHSQGGAMVAEEGVNKVQIPPEKAGKERHRMGLGSGCGALRGRGKCECC